MGRASLAIGVIASVMTLASTGAGAREVSIRRESLPAAVRDALGTRYPGAKFMGLTREKEKGVMLYEAEMKVSGRRVDALMDANGALREEEAQIAQSELPETVRQAHAQSAQAHWKIESIERISFRTASTPQRFELRVSDGKRHLELIYGANGKRLSAGVSDAKE